MHLTQNSVVTKELRHLTVMGVSQHKTKVMTETHCSNSSVQTKIDIRSKSQYCLIYVSSGNNPP